MAHTVNGPRARAEGLVIAGPDLKRGIRAAMGREGVLSISELSRRSGVRRDTMYGWFRKPKARVSAGSIEKLVNALGSAPGDPWYDAPSERTLDPETRGLLDAAVDRAMARLERRMIEVLDQRLGRSADEDAP